MGRAWRRYLLAWLAPLAIGLAPAGGVADETAPAGQTPPPAVPAAPTEADAGDEFLIFGDRFARWDHTRWYAEMQIGFPRPMLVQATQNYEMRLLAVQLRSQFACEKTWRRGKHGFEVVCDIEDVSIRGVAFETNPKEPDKILGELDALATAATLRLYVTDDGKITNIDLEGIPAENDRQQAVREQIRTLFMRLMAGFHMKLPKDNQMYQGQWVEYNSPMFLLPGMTAARSGGYLVNQVNPYRKHLVVQTIGDATIGDGNETEGLENMYTVHFDGVSIYSPDTGIMTERVYAMQGMTTASSPLSDGWRGGRYFHTGRVQMLGEKENIKCGSTGRVTAPEQPEVPGVAMWVPLE